MTKKPEKEHSDEERYILYTDGSARLSNKRFYGAWAYVVLDGHHQELASAAAPVWDTTISRMELMAIIKGLEYVLETTVSSEKPKVAVYSDSQYAVKSIMWWIPTWKKNGWKNHVGVPVKNQDLMETLAELREKIRLTAWHVRGHSGNIYNEKVDKLASSLTLKMQNGELKPSK